MYAQPSYIQDTKMEFIVNSLPGHIFRLFSMQKKAQSQKYHLALYVNSKFF